MDPSISQLRTLLSLPDDASLIETPTPGGAVLSVRVGPDATDRGTNPSAWLEFALENDGVLLAPRGQKMRMPLPALALLIEGVQMAGKRMAIGWIAVHGARDTVPVGEAADAAWDVIIVGWPYANTDPLLNACAFRFTINVPVRAQAYYGHVLTDIRVESGSIGFDGDAHILDEVEAQYGHLASRPSFFWFDDNPLRRFNLPPRAYTPRSLAPDNVIHSQPTTYHPFPHGYAVVVPALSPPLEPGTPMCLRSGCGLVAP